MSSSRSTLRAFPLREVIKRTWAEVRADDVFGRAAQLAYYFFVALFPFLISVIATLSVFGSADRGRALLFQFLSRALPPTAFALINQTFTEIIRSHGPLKMSAGIVFSLWSASAGMSAVMDTLNAAYKVKENRSLLRQYAVAAGLTLGIALLLVLSIIIVIFGDRIIQVALPAGIGSSLWEIAQWPLAIALILLAFAITYYFAPDFSIREWHWITPGAILGVILWLVASLGLRLYLHFFGTYSSTYGSLGAVIILLLWFYLSGIAVLSGGVLNGVLQRLESSTGITRRRDAPLQNPLLAR